MENTIERGKKAKLSMDELSVICEQLALILRAGLPLHDGVEALADPYQDTRYAESFAALSRTVVETGSLYTGMQQAGVFPPYLMEMTGIGEKTGELQKVMEQMAAYYEREAKIKRAIGNAITYPLLLIVMMAGLITVLIVQVLPVLEDVMRGMGLGMESSGWMNIGANLGKGILIVTGVLIVIALVLVLIMKNSANSAARQWIFRVISPLRRMNSKLYASRFAANMGMMLGNGYPLDESLGLIHGIITDEDVRGRVEQCREGMQEGMSFPDAVVYIGLFEKLHCRMIKVGFQAGQTERVMNKLAGIYEEEMDDAIQRIVSIIEPSLVALMSIIIGAILLSVMIPLIGILTALG